MIETLKALSLPVFHAPKPENLKASKYLTYDFIGQVGRVYAESAQGCSGCTFALDLYSQTDPWPDVAEVRSTLSAAGYITVAEAEDYEVDTGYHHVALTAYTAREEYI